MKTNWWYESGMAAQAAQELVWFVVLVFVAIGILIWRDIRKEEKQEVTKTRNNIFYKPSKTQFNSTGFGYLIAVLLIGYLIWRF